MEKYGRWLGLALVGCAVVGLLCIGFYAALVASLPFLERTSEDLERVAKGAEAASTAISAEQTARANPAAKATPAPPIVVSDSSGSVARTGYRIIGEVENVSSSPRTFVKVIATVYDAGGRVLGTAFTYSRPENLAPGALAPFETTVTVADAAAVTRYKLDVDSSPPR